MKQNYNFKIENIKNLSPEEMSLRKKNLELFYQTGFPLKKLLIIIFYQKRKN